MDIVQPNINPAHDYDTTTTSCNCPTRVQERPWEPCKHIVRLMVRMAEDDRVGRSAWDRRSQGSRKDQVHADRRELAREREAA
jgi:uncharacterized Zn finger protein